MAVSANEIKIPPIERFGLSQVYSTPDPEFDIVLVHGLNGHPEKTWTADNNTFWPTQLLSQSLGTLRARVLVYGYNADVYAFKGNATTDMIHQHAQTLIGNLQADRFDLDATQRPIIWVGHSLGGILIKRALNYSRGLTSKHNIDQRDIYISTFGILFLGTPHNGSDSAKWGKMLESLFRVASPLVSTETGSLLTTLKNNSETLQNINIEFANIHDRFSMYLFHESVPTSGVGIVVDQTSAGTILPGCQYAGIEATHSGMCKFGARGSPGYTLVAATIKKYCQQARGIISEQRWPEEMDTRKREGYARGREEVGMPYSGPSDSMNLKPQGQSSHATSSASARTTHAASGSKKATPMLEQKGAPSRSWPPGEEFFDTGYTVEDISEDATEKVPA